MPRAGQPPGVRAHWTLASSHVLTNRDIHYLIVELEGAIVRELEQHVLHHSALLLQLAALLAELDWCAKPFLRLPLFMPCAAYSALLLLPVSSSGAVLC